MNMSRTRGIATMRNILETAAEITTITAFGSMIAVWAMILGHIA
jgi:hypothetical protein